MQHLELTWPGWLRSFNNILQMFWTFYVFYFPLIFTSSAEENKGKLKWSSHLYGGRPLFHWTAVATFVPETYFSPQFQCLLVIFMDRLTRGVHGFVTSDFAHYVATET